MRAVVPQFASLAAPLPALLSALTLAVVTAARPAPALSADIAVHTGDETGSYHSGFCPALSKALAKSGHTVDCRPSAGTAENMQRVSDNPEAFAYGQLDVLALEAGRHGGPGAFEKVRLDDVRECLFAVASNREISNFGEVAARAADLRFVLPPERSGSAKTFDYLQSIDAWGLGRGRDISYADTTDAAIEAALANDRTVALFVQFPDPDNVRFKMIKERGGHIIPVLDRNILSQTVAGNRVYFAQETKVANAGWLASGTEVVTACTPLVLFTGDNARISDRDRRDRHDELVRAIAGLPAETLLPRQTFFARMIRRTRELSSAGAERFIDISERARERAQPLFDKARDAAARAVEAAKPRQNEGQ